MLIWWAAAMTETWKPQNCYMSKTSKIFLNQVTDDLVIEILNRIVPILEADKIDYFIVGAFARDLGLMAKGFRLLSARKTEDLDLAVLVGSTAYYEELIGRIAAVKDFVRDENEPYRLHFKKAYKVMLRSAKVILRNDIY